MKNERYTSEELIQFCVGVLSKFRKEIKRLHKYLSAIGNGIALLKQLDLEMKTDHFKQLEKLDDLSSMVFPLLLVEVCGKYIYSYRRHLKNVKENHFCVEI